MSHEWNSALDKPAKSLLVVLSGLSGTGKDTVLNSLRESGYPLELIVTITTRDKRPGETDGMPYNFISKDRFREMIDRDELLEWATVYGNYYGVPKEPVRQALGRNRDVIVKVDVQGAATIKKILPQAVFVFLAPPSMEELIKRLRGRRTESPSDLNMRIETAKEELKQLPLFDYLVVNRQGEIDRAVADVKAIITAEKCRVGPRDLTL